LTTFISKKRWVFNLLTQRFTDKQYFQLMYLLAFKKLPNLDHPRNLNEKTIWRILFDRKEIYSRLTDKVGMRDYIREIGLAAHLPKTYFIGTNPREIPFDDLPPTFVVKPNHASGQIIIANEQSLVDTDELIRICDEWLAFSYYDRAREWPYKNIEPKIIVEELLGEPATLPIYKIHCFHGEPKIIVAGIGFTSGNLRFGAYDLEWNKQKLDYPAAQQAEFSKPKRLAEMIEFSATLSKPFDYVRTDIYQLEDRLVIGEFTFTSANGLDANRGKLTDIMGDYWQFDQTLERVH